jgi:hypothetical protein
MNDKTKENLKILSIGVIGIIIASLLSGCGTTSFMRCDKYIGPEKEYCLEKYKQQTDNMDYRSFRGGGLNPVIDMR